MREICGDTGKRSYLTKHAAREANAHNGLRIRVYRCPYCHYFHVTKLAYNGSPK